MKIVPFALMVVIGATTVSAQSAPRVATTIGGAELKDLEAVRKAVWVDWFSGDTASLRRALGPELVAMSPGAPYWQSLEETLASSAKFKAGGGRFLSVAFDSSTIHRFGNVVVMFSRYTVVTETNAERGTLQGRATELFVRANGRWVHTSWHLDETPDAASP
jgi:hypothetical protein